VDALLPVRAALNVETCQLQLPTAPVAPPTVEVAWENRFVIFGHDGPTPYLIRHQECHTAPLTRLSLFAIALRFVCYVSRRHVFSAYTIMCRDPPCRDAPSMAVCFFFFSPVADHDELQ